MRNGRAEAEAGVRGLIGASVLVSAYIHGELYAQGIAQTPVIGPLFLLNAVAGLIIGVAVLFWRHWLPVLAGLGFGVATLAAFWISLTVGLFGLREQLSGVPQLAAGGAELVAVLAALGWFAAAARGRVRDEARASA